MSHAARPDASGRQPVMFDTASRLFAIIIGIVAVISGLVVGINNPLLSNSAGREGTRIDQLFSLTLGIATVVFVLVQGFLLYSIVRFGRQPDDDTDGPAVRGNTRLEFFWTLIPAITIFFIGFVSYGTLANIEKAAPDELVVEVKAFQFAWQFYYPEFDVTSGELHAPVDRQLHLKLRSNDVVHSFWVPAMRIKKDAMPDRVTETYITPTETGSYPIVCTELCGAGHAVMRSQMVVQPDADFRGWITSQQKSAVQAAAGASDPLAKGRQVFNNSGCNACHALKDAGAAGAVGPKLDGIGTTAAAREPGVSAEEYIHQSIVKPNEFVAQGFPANVMPQDYGQRLAEADLDALVKYLAEMK
jgi:cytochrome c oxidase subunit II